MVCGCWGKQLKGSLGIRGHDPWGIRVRWFGTATQAGDSRRSHQDRRNVMKTRTPTTPLDIEKGLLEWPLSLKLLAIRCRSADQNPVLLKAHEQDSYPP
jgi:hypothetical protein